MENIIKSIIECDSIYGIVALSVFLLGVALVLLVINKIIQTILPYLDIIICKLCDTIKSYKKIRSKTNVKDASFETELHR